MGDNAVIVTKEEITQHARLMRENTEQDVALMEKLFAFADGSQKKAQKLQEQLLEEEKKLEQTQNELSNCQAEVKDLQAKNTELEVKVAGATKEFEEKTVELRQSNEEKSAKLEELYQLLADQESLMKGLKYLRNNVDAFRIGQGILKEPCGACMLPNGNVLVADTMEGLLLFSANTELIRQVTSEEWKWPQGLVYDTEKSHIMVSMVKKFGDKFKRVIVVFSTKLEELRTIDGPENAGYDTVSKERLALAPNGELYLTLADKVGSALYKYMAGNWFLLTQRQGATFIDVQVLSTQVPITQVLVVESRMGYVHKLAIRGGDIADRRSMAVVEKPGAICVDEKGELFIQDVMSGKILQVDTFKLESKKDICIVDDAVFSITASHGYLGVAVREAKLVRIFRYEAV